MRNTAGTTMNIAPHPHPPPIIPNEVPSGVKAAAKTAINPTARMIANTSQSTELCCLFCKVFHLEEPTRQKRPFRTS